MSGLYDFLAWQARQLLPDTADPEYLEQHCALRGITRKPATRATGTLTLTGRAGAVVPAGTQAKDLSGVLYRTTAGATLSGAAEAATAAVPCEAVDAGALPDLDDAPVTLLAAPSGVQSAARLTLTGGSDAEDDATLLAAPEGFTMTVRDVRLSAGAGFVVVIMGSIMTMPGLPNKPAAENIDVDENGRITGLF